MRDRILSQDERKSIFTAVLQMIGSGHDGEAQTMLRLLRRDELGLGMEPEQHQAAQGVAGLAAGIAPQNWQNEQFAKAAAEAQRLMKDARY